ncbi:MAG: hypothetical protein H0T48_11675 [Gemmatimonadaceae bacterium]|nr:hypothetical protein [Gemmatimonadaceae bacterium]
MRLNSIELEWFRGAADTVSLDVGGKSAVVYGTNGAGKSSFVDAVEYIINEGRIGHLTHEYSGRKQERGVINTHTPTLSPTHVSIEFANGTGVRVDVKTSGACTKSGNGLAELMTWDYRRVVLRQDEVAAFVSSPKGAKYSALLPLLGLEPLEYAAENVRQLGKGVEKSTQIVEKRERLRAATEAAQIFSKGHGDISAELRKIHSRYLPDVSFKADRLGECQHLLKAIRRRVESLSADGRSYAALSEIAGIPLAEAISGVRDAGAALAQSTETLIEERLTVLDHALRFVTKSGAPKHIACPACGRDIQAAELESHLKAENERLLEAATLFSQYRSANNRLGDALSRLQSAFTKEEVLVWATSRNDGGKPQTDYLATLDASAIRKGCNAQQLQGIESLILPLISAAAASTGNQPPEAPELLLDRETVVAAEAVIAAEGLSHEVKSVDALLDCLLAVEKGVRDQIRLRSDEIMAGISGDIQRMWSILHPNEAIEGVRLSHPDDADKAIDIELTFHGVEQKSPRLTLSEGNRNSLGLCVFLSMAKRDVADTPVILDDVVVSLDRNHRGMVVDLVEQEFADRQVLIFTHDRDWYIELRSRLEAKDWRCSTLRPYGKPTNGITWSTKSWGFDDARALLEDSPDAAGNTARKIMDVELATRAEKLRIKMPYLHGFRNDLRMAHGFLEALAGASQQALQKKSGKGYEPFAQAANALTAADKLLTAWGNRASHSFDVTPVEATKLIEACEEALSVFDCAACGKPVHKFDDGNGTLQCACSELRWRYSKL